MVKVRAIVRATCHQVVTRRVLLALVFAVRPLVIDARKKRRGRRKKWSGDCWTKERVVIFDATGPELDGYIPLIVHNWQAALGNGLHLEYQRLPPATDCAEVSKRNGAIVVCNKRHDAQFPTGKTTLWCNKHQPHHITAALVQLVAQAWGTNSEESGYWWHPMGCHELGHALGLQHPSDWGASTCMGVQWQAPGPRDVAQLKAKYHGKGCRCATTPELVEL